MNHHCFLLAAMTLLFATAPTASVAADNPAPSPPKERKICRSEASTGSIMGRRICRTKAEWDAINEKSAHNLENYNDQRGSTGVPTLPGS